MPERNTTLTRLGLMAGIAMPLVYYGIQIAAAPGYPDYDFTRQVASLLGTPESRWAAAFNAGILAVGLLTLIAAAGQFQAIRRRGRSIVPALLAAAAMACFGVATLLAGLFPLPDPRHASGGPLILGAVTYPALTLLVFWKQPRWRAVFLVCLLAMAAAVLTMTGVIELDRARWAGLIQRPVALAMVGPMALASWALLRELRRSEA